MGAMQQMVKKTIELDQKAIKKARQIFEVKTDKEAVNRALRLVAEENDIIQTHISLAGQVDLKDLFS